MLLFLRGLVGLCSGICTQDIRNVHLDTGGLKDCAKRGIAAFAFGTGSYFGRSVPYGVSKEWRYPVESLVGEFKTLVLSTLYGQN